MATYRVIAWQDIPMIVEARDAAGEVTLSLSERFQALIDSVAMQQGLHESDAYVEAWRKGPEEERPGTAREVGEAVVAELEARFPEIIARAFSIRP